MFGSVMYGSRGAVKNSGETQNTVCNVPANVIGTMSVSGSNGMETIDSFCVTVADGM